MSTANTKAPPEEVMVEYLGALHGVLTRGQGTYREGLVPVLRGSLLMRQWYGGDARPAADIDLEAFLPPGNSAQQSEKDPNDELEDTEEEWGERGDGLGPEGQYLSRLDWCRCMCRYAAESTINYARRATQSVVEFNVIEALQSAEIAAWEAAGFQGRPPAPAGGASLWTYATPGERYFCNWKWNGRKLSGQLQIDIAESRSYGIDDIDTRTTSLTRLDASQFPFVTYTPEMLLAAKLSWLLRSFKPGDSAASLVWSGEPKDLFDAHLLAARPLEHGLDPAAFQKSLTAIGIEDDLDWSQLDALLAAGRATPADSDFPRWDVFEERHRKILPCGPGAMLSALVAKLGPLLGEFHPGDDASFLAAIAADPIDEFPYVLYADKLEERGHSGAQFLRRFVEVYFHKDELTKKRKGAANQELAAALTQTAKPWLLRLFGTSARYREMTGRIAEEKL